MGMKGCGAVPPEAVRAPVLAASVLALPAVRLAALPCSCPDGPVPAPERLTGRLLAAAAMLRFTTGRQACRVRCMVQLLLQVVCVAHAAACAVWQLLVRMLLHGASPGPPARHACNSLDACKSNAAHDVFVARSYLTLATATRRRQVGDTLAHAYLTPPRPPKQHQSRPKALANPHATAVKSGCGVASFVKLLHAQGCVAGKHFTIAVMKSKCHPAAKPQRMQESQAAAYILSPM